MFEAETELAEGGCEDRKDPGIKGKLPAIDGQFREDPLAFPVLGFGFNVVKGPGQHGEFKSHQAMPSPRQEATGAIQLQRNLTGRTRLHLTTDLPSLFSFSLAASGEPVVVYCRNL